MKYGDKVYYLAHIGLEVLTCEVDNISPCKTDEISLTILTKTYWLHGCNILSRLTDVFPYTKEGKKQAQAALIKAAKAEITACKQRIINAERMITADARGKNLIGKRAFKC